MRPETIQTPQAMAEPEVELAHLRLPLDPDEASWVRRAQAGEEAAFDWLMIRYRDRAVRLAAHILRRPAEAEDLAQEAFLRAFWQIRRFRGDCAFYTWLYRIIVRLCLNRKRAPWWRRDSEPISGDETFVESQEPLSNEAFETRLLIENLLDRLTPPLRAALVLRELEGLEYAEIAEALEIPVGTVRSRLNAARAQLRTLWQRAMEESHHV
ncbi:MAG TPA: sigma-70 family RNA polymerase sigma factor [Chthonomonadaceae bacterium]|nr:sigma-70 family RNA polymerase sigma factor [Chthonomonadaceae bacterium]